MHTEYKRRTKCFTKQQVLLTPQNSLTNAFSYSVSRLSYGLKYACYLTAKKVNIMRFVV